jgi:predicted SAM-dependent methyltransferase
MQVTSVTSKMKRKAKAILLGVGRKCLLPPQMEVLSLLLTELKISSYHHKGIARIRRHGLLHPTKLNLGAGAFCKSGFLNVDLFPGGDLTLDLRRGLPFASNCCETIFSEHFFEHIEYPKTISNLFHECLRVLRPGGLLSFSVPDTEWPLIDYQHGPEAPYFRACLEHHWHPDCTTRIEHINYHFRQRGQHLFAYDQETLQKLLESVGFANVRKRAYDPEIDSEHRRVGSLFISAMKPLNHN